MGTIVTNYQTKCQYERIHTDILSFTVIINRSLWKQVTDYNFYINLSKIQSTLFWILLVLVSRSPVTLPQGELIDIYCTDLPGDYNTVMSMNWKLVKVQTDDRYS